MTPSRHPSALALSVVASLLLVACEARLDVGALCVSPSLRCPVGGEERCVDPREDPEHCGGCGIRCEGACVDGACCERGEESCRVGEALACIDVSRSEEHCGACGVACSADEACVDGACCAETVCETAAGLRCVDVRRDPEHCGACGRGCDGICEGGVCCPRGRAWCEGACVDPSTDASHCGGCGRACAGGVCVEGACCEELGGLVCGADGVTRCVDPTSDPSHCGACGVSCGAGTCLEGTCCAKACGDVCIPDSYTRLELWGGREGIGVHAADLDGDGYDDVLWNMQLDERVEIHWGNAEGGLGEPTVVPFGRVGVGLAVGDVDGDGYPDLVASVQASGPPLATELRVFFGDGARGFSRSVVSAQSGNPGPVALLDANGDDLLDVVVRLPSSGCTALRLGRGDGTFEPSACVLPFATLADNESLAALRRGGATHLLDLRLLASGAELWEHRFADGEVVASERIAVPTSFGETSYPVGLDVLDVDGDGHDEIFLFERAAESHVVHWLQEEWCTFGSGLVPESGADGPPRRTEYLHAAADFDGDGTVELAGRSTCGYCGTVKTLHRAR